MKAGDSEVPPDVDFQIPSWAGKAPSGTHLDVYKGDKLLQVSKSVDYFLKNQSTELKNYAHINMYLLFTILNFKCRN